MRIFKLNLNAYDDAIANLSSVYCRSDCVFQIFYENEIDNLHRTKNLYEVYFDPQVNLSKLS